MTLAYTSIHVHVCVHVHSTHVVCICVYLSVIWDNFIWKDVEAYLGWLVTACWTHCVRHTKYRTVPIPNHVLALCTALWESCAILPINLFITCNDHNIVRYSRRCTCIHKPFVHLCSCPHNLIIHLSDIVYFRVLSNVRIQSLNYGLSPCILH